MTASMARALESAGHRVAQSLLTLRAVVSTHQATGRAGTGADVALQPDLDRLADAVVQATSQIAAALRAAGPDRPPLPSLPPLRTLQRAIWLEPSSHAGGGLERAAGSLQNRTTQPQRAVPADGEAAGLFAATDSLVDAINTAGHVLRPYVPAADRGDRRPG